MYSIARYALVPLTSLLVCVSAPAQVQNDPEPKSGVGQENHAGDLRRVHWVRPWAKAQEESRRTGRPILCKPILGGSNTPDPSGLPCGGKNDCEGSW
jgi:hypothetical protein